VITGYKNSSRKFWQARRWPKKSAWLLSAKCTVQLQCLTVHSSKIKLTTVHEFYICCDLIDTPSSIHTASQPAHWHTDLVTGVPVLVSSPAENKSYLLMYSKQYHQRNNSKSVSVNTAAIYPIHKEIQNILSLLADLFTNS